MLKIYSFFRNVFAVIGVLGTCAAVLAVVFVMKTRNVNLEELYVKAVKIAGVNIQTASEKRKQDAIQNLTEMRETYKALAIALTADVSPCDQEKVIDKRVIRVGPTRKYQRPSQAARVVKQGDIVEIDADVYEGDVAVWKADDLILRGVNGRPHLEAKGKNAQGKGIWVIYGNNITVENIVFSGAKVPSLNGAGIRGQGDNLTVNYCAFINNENGILSSGKKGGGFVRITHSEFGYNGHGDGRSHGIYINSSKVRRLEFEYNYMHHSIIGHHIKSRAFENIILFNRLLDEYYGNSSMAIDIPNGGKALIMGNVFHQSRFADNFRIIKFQNINKEKVLGLYVINNTVLSDRDGLFVDNRTPVSALIANNFLIGKLKTVSGKETSANNIVGKISMIKQLGRYDFHLKQNANAINAGRDLAGMGDQVLSLVPGEEYMHPMDAKKRKQDGKIDAGAFEY